MLLEKKITRFSLTDHDTIDGIQKARMLSRDRITFISGIEFTCQEKTLDAVSLPFSIHLLGYGFDENDPDLIKALEARKQRVLEVFESLLNAANISIKQAIRLIHKAGGRAVWAHPLFVYRNFEKRKLEKEEIQYYISSFFYEELSTKVCRLFVNTEKIIACQYPEKKASDTEYDTEKLLGEIRDKLKKAQLSSKINQLDIQKKLEEKK